MGSVQKPRNVRLHGRRTSMRLEAPFWEALEDIATLRNRSVESICENIAGGLHRGNLSSAIRVYVLAWWRKRARPDAAPSPADKRGTRAPPALFGKFALCHTRPTYNLKEIQPKASPRSRRR